MNSFEDETPHPTDLRIHIQKLKDHRIDRNKKHSLHDVVMIVVSGLICGHEGWDSITAWANLRQEWFRSFLDLSNGIPSSDTCRRVFERLNPQALQQCLTEWITALRKKSNGQVIAIDGKTIRGVGQSDSGKPLLHSLSAWVAESGLSLAQIKTDIKSNEITAIPLLLELIDIEDSIVTIDAMGCQTKIAQAIRDKKGDYVLALKGNHPNLQSNIAGFFEIQQANGFKDVAYQSTTTVDKGHGRVEKREYWHVADLAWLAERTQWPGLASIGMVKRTRTTSKGTSEEMQFYLSSLPLNVERFAHAVRSHWSIENSLHWVLDVTFNEDGCRIRKDHAPENLAILRRTVLSLLKSEGVCTDSSNPHKRMRAAYDLDFFEHVLLGTPYSLPPKPAASDSRKKKD